VGGGLGATVTDYSTTHANLPTLSNPYVGTLTTDAQAVAAILSTVKNVFNGVINLISNFINDVANLINSDEVQLTATNTTYANIVAAANAGVLVPPSGAIAGVYAAVDATRGVWKAPANVSLNTVISPAVNIDDDMQGDLNIDTNAGKSINAIRSFTGKGILVWGSRTLDGNDNNWRYVPVRRFFIMVEESVKLAAFQFVFEPNVSSTWLRIKAMIENYLTGLWRLGAITGAKPEQGFYVKVGLGQTMTQDDILNGRLIVEVGIAPVRPAEFIILRFTQTQQQA
ncbi:MAG: phage tail sheath family protein, partial [Mucilaginibacter sp.]